MEEKVETKEVTRVETVAPEQVVKTTTSVVPPQVRTEHPQQIFEKKRAIFRMNQIIWYLLAVIEVLLAFRVSLKAIGANPQSFFVSFIYSVSDLFALPFRGIIPTASSGASVFEWSTIIAAIVYALIAYGIIHLIHLIKPVSPHEVSEGVDDHSHV
jgi:hypothetical protein